MNRLASFLYRWRFYLSAALVAGAVVLLPRANLTHVDNDIRTWFSEDDPLYRDYDRFQAEFGGTQPLIIAVQASPPASSDAGAGIFTRERLSALKEISDEIERIPSVARVESLATVNLLRSQPPPADTASDLREDSLQLKPLLDLEDRSPDEIRRLALDDPLLRGDLVSADGMVTALIVTFDEPRLNEARVEILNRIYSAVSSKLPDGLAASYNGSIEINETYNRVTVKNQRQFVPPILVLTLLAVYSLFRSLRRALVVLISVAVSVVWTLGLYSLMGFGFNILTAMLTPLVVVLAISDDVHLIQHFDAERSRAGAEEAFKRTVSYLFAPLLGASGTTALGLLSLATSDVIAIRHFGIGAAVGVMVDFGASLILIPTALAYLPPESRVARGEHFITRPLQRAAAFATRRPGVVLAVTMVVAVVATAGVMRLRVDTNHIRFFSPSHPLSRSAGVIDRSLAGVYGFQVLLEGPPDSMKSPDIVRRIDQLTTALGALPQVRKATSMADHVKRAHRELHGGAPSAAVVSEDPLVVAQELFLVGLNDQGRRELARTVSSDYSTAQITVRMPSMSSGRVFELIETAHRMAVQTFQGTAVRATATGSGRLFSALDHYVVTSQIRSFGTAFLTILVTMFFIFRSVRYGVLALVPNLLPVLGVLGVMGWIGISINIATVMVASVALGVVDDDTVHFLHRFRRALAGGDSVDVAARIAATFEGRAAFTTALINTCGFSVLLLSEYKPSAWFGGLLALTLGTAFLVEVLVMPAAVKLGGSALRADVDTGVQAG